MNPESEYYLQYDDGDIEQAKCKHNILLDDECVECAMDFESDSVDSKRIKKRGY